MIIYLLLLQQNYSITPCLSASCSVEMTQIVVFLFLKNEQTATQIKNYNSEKKFSLFSQSTIRFLLGAITTGLGLCNL